MALENLSSLVKELREVSGAGMLDCKKTIVETNGDIEKAVALLRQKGLGQAAKKSSRVASEGLVSVKISQNRATICEINSETDFVAGNDKFKALVSNVISNIQDNNINDLEALKSSSINGEGFEDYINNQIATIGENIVVRRFENIDLNDTTLANGYTHSNGRIAVIISAKVDNNDSNEKVKEFLKQLSMHAAAMSPSYLDASELDASFIEAETVAIKKEIEKENIELGRLGKPLKNIPQYVSSSQLTDDVLAKVEEDIKSELKAQGKPEQIWDRIVPGQIARFISDNTVLDQKLILKSQFFVMDDKKTISQVVEEKSKEFGVNITLDKYIRFELGEGIEKEECDFAAEVANAMK